MRKMRELPMRVCHRNSWTHRANEQPNGTSPIHSATRAPASNFLASFVIDSSASKLGEFVGRLREYKQKGLGELAARAKRTFENASQKLDEMRARHEQLKADLQDREGKLTRKERMVAEIDANIEYRWVSLGLRGMHMRTAELSGSTSRVSLAL